MGGLAHGMETTPANRPRFAAKRIKEGELLIVATNLDDEARALNLYRKRWGIECLFADAKTRGLNIEDTHITDPDKLATLLVVVALAVTWAYRCATRVMGRKRSGESPTAGARNHGSASASTPCETGSFTSPNRPSQHGTRLVHADR